MGKKSVYSYVNYILSLLCMAILGLIAWVTIKFCQGELIDFALFKIFGSYEKLSKGIVLFRILFIDGVIFCLLTAFQVLLTALSMGRKDKYTELDYGHIVEFNKFVLVLYALYMVGLPIASIVVLFF